MELAQQASNSITPTLLYSISHGVRTYSGLLQHAVVHVLANSAIGSERAVQHNNPHNLVSWLKKTWAPHRETLLVPPPHFTFPFQLSHFSFPISAFSSA